MFGIEMTCSWSGRWSTSCRIVAAALGRIKGAFPLLQSLSRAVWFTFMGTRPGNSSSISSCAASHGGGSCFAELQVGNMSHSFRMYRKTCHRQRWTFVRTNAHGVVCGNEEKIICIGSSPSTNRDRIVQTETAIPVGPKANAISSSSSPSTSCVSFTFSQMGHINR
jgi:hypothetical protein